MAVPKRMNRTRIPVALRPLAPLVEKWGCVEDADREAAAERAETNPDEMAELKKLAAKWSPRVFEYFERWGERIPEDGTFEYWKFYFARLLIAELEAWPRETRKAIDRVAEEMGKLKRHGSYRFASERMWAARSLPDYGPPVRRAIPLLRICLNDEDFRVQVWAHVALALIDGNADDHRKAIDRIRRGRIPQGKHPQDSEALAEGRSEARYALTELKKTPAQRNLSALIGAAIVNDLVNARRLLKQVDVNAADHDKMHVIEFAVGGCHAEMVALLLKHGANPNVGVKTGETVLHDAAASRDALQIIKLLVRHGAKINSLNAKKQTPLDVALECKRAENVKLLRRLGALSAAQLPSSVGRRRSVRG